MIFTTGHQANLALIPTLCGPEDAVLLDAEAHASLFDAARLSGAGQFVFRHGDTGDLERKLARIGRPTWWWRRDCTASRGRVLPDVELITGTFSKALGSVGGFVVSDHPWLPLLHFSACAMSAT